MKRWLPFLMFGLALIGLGLVLSNYASDQAEKISNDSSSEAKAADPAQAAACERAQAKYDELWDASLENPEDAEKEEELGVALGELYQACGSPEADDLAEAEDAAETEGAE